MCWVASSIPHLYLGEFGCEDQLPLVSCEVEAQGSRGCTQTCVNISSNFAGPIYQPSEVRSFTLDAQSKRTEASDRGNSSLIHPCAIVHPNAIIGEGVSVGPFCSVSSSARLGNFCKLYPGSHIFGSTELGNNCTLMTGAVVGDDLPGCTIIGKNNVIGYHAVIGVKCQDLKFKMMNVSWKLVTIMILGNILQSTDLQSQLIGLLLGITI